MNTQDQIDYDLHIIGSMLVGMKIVFAERPELFTAEFFDRIVEINELSREVLNVGIDSVV